MNSLLKMWIAIFAGGLLIGALILAWVTLLGPAFNQAGYHLFNDSPQHQNAVAQKFSDDCMQLAETSDPIARKAIEQDIAEVASTVNVDSVEMPDTVRACVNKALNDVSSGK